MKINLIKTVQLGLCLVALSALLLTACGGGSGGGASAGTGVTPGVATTLTGTAATGMPIIGKVVAIDATGKILPSTTTDALGAYTLNVAGGTPPYILTVTGTAGGKMVSLTSVATAAGQTVNITPLTDLIVSTAAGQPGGAALVNLCTPTVQAACTSALNNAAKTANLNAAVTVVTNMIASAASAVAGVAIPNLLNGAFTANGTGMDALLDALLVAPATAQSGGGATATVTLISVPGAAGQLGLVTMPFAAGGSAASAVTAPSGTTLTAAVTAASTLSDINACMASLGALYPANLTVAPASSVVAPFIDPTFSVAGPAVAPNPAIIIGLLSTLSSTGGIAAPNYHVQISGFAPYDFTPQIAPAALLTTTPPLSATVAWVNFPSRSGDGLNTWKMVKGAAYSGCPGGWRLAGSQHISISNLARIAKNASPTGTTYSRELSFNVSTADAKAEGVTSIVATAPGLSVYSGTPVTPASGVAPLTLIMPPPATPPAITQTVMGFQGQIDVPGSFYGGAEAIKSCQDLAVANIAPAGTPCFDETVMAPASILKYAVTGTQNYSFQRILGSVPLSVAFAQANDADLFAQNMVASPAGVTALNVAVAGIAVGTQIDGIIKFTYTLSNVYGAFADHCNIGLNDANNVVVLQAEMSAVGQQTSCTFTAAGVGNGSLAKPAVPFGGTNSWMDVADNVLGNQAVSGQPY